MIRVNVIPTRRRGPRRPASLMLVIGVLATAVLIAQPRVFAQAISESILGSWVLDVSKSTFTGTGAPDSRTMKFERVPTGIKHVTETLSGQGGFNQDRYRLEYTFKIDGQDNKADVQMPVSTVSFKQVDATTLERSGKYQGKVIETVTYVISADRKTLTVTQKATAGNAEVSSVQVFQRQ